MDCITEPSAADVPLVALTPGSLDGWAANRGPTLASWIAANAFRAEAGKLLPVPAADGRIERVLVGLGDSPELWSWAGPAEGLPPGRYAYDPTGPVPAGADAALAWALATYRFTRYKADARQRPRLGWPSNVDRDAVRRTAEAVWLARDLVNTPAGDLGPEELAGALEELAGRHGARSSVIVGDRLLVENYPAVHAVGRAASREPRLAELVWGEESAPRVTLVGKGVVFDSGGLDLKPADGMKLMKKDMGGAAAVLGLAHMVMDAGLGVRLRVLVPAVENAVSGDAFRPLDVLSTRKGLTVEVGNTDAEGRLILCDALAEADAEKPEVLVDFATLTGAARVALGAEIPALFANDDGLADALLAASRAVADPLWRLPLHADYRRLLDSPVADLNNVGSSRLGGAITAALFLREFVSPTTPWAHVDTMAWNESARPGRPVGGEALGIRAVFRVLAERYG